MTSLTLRHLPDGTVKMLVVCDICQRAQTVGWATKAQLSSATAEMQAKAKDSAADFVACVGWSETEKGWLCPFHSDRGAAKLTEVFCKTSTKVMQA
jgi:hypothetical protein